jgi:5-(carboxyamino)imidazole ribonucleotide mutase
MTASLTALPVVGVPIKGKNLEGLDSLLSIVQMPPGIPVATVAINAAKNAGLLAVKILALENPTLQKRLAAASSVLNAEVKKKARKLEALGHRKYLSEYGKK